MEFSARRRGEIHEVLSLSSPLPWIVHRGNWKDFRQAFSPLWSYSQGAWVSVSVRISGYTLGHTFGVRVDGLSVSRLKGRYLYAAG